MCAGMPQLCSVISDSAQSIVRGGKSLDCVHLLVCKDNSSYRQGTSKVRRLIEKSILEHTF